MFPAWHLGNLCMYVCVYIYIFFFILPGKFWLLFFKKFFWICCFYEKVLVTQFCLTLCDSKDSNLPGSSVHGISQARILEWIAIHLSRNQTWISCIADGLSTVWATRKSLWFTTIHSGPQGIYPFAHLPVPSTRLVLHFIGKSFHSPHPLCGREWGCSRKTQPWPAGSSRGLHWGVLSGAAPWPCVLSMSTGCDLNTQEYLTHLSHIYSPNIQGMWSRLRCGENKQRPEVLYFSTVSRQESTEVKRNPTAGPHSLPSCHSQSVTRWMGSVVER